MTWKPVSKDEFFRGIGRQNVHPTIVNDRWPYTSEFKTPSGEVRGRIEGYLPAGSALAENRYYLLEPQP